ncbi:flagellar hook-basal body complex protein [Candidatus Ponderosibacter sp. Uisw_141_02]|uniref:flagellar hook-basal body complex protein n=1 Tax=Candidatus Ponderosibacter sp. Uisw_141_02 TaxID=3231000 RepID=UPI003D54EBAB
MSFYTALTGLNGSQADISATSNNIANVGTTGFKRSRAEFGDIFATSPLQNASSSIGSGTILKGIKQQFTQGNISSSLNALDLAISGQGFFTLKPSLTSAQKVYTRNGSLNVNNDRYVVDSAGQYLLVYPVNDDGSVTAKDLDSALPLQLPVTSGDPQATSNIELGVNVPAAADVVPARPEFADGYTFDPSNPNTFTNSTSITIFDDLGNPTIATMYFIKTQSASANDPTNKYDTRLVINDTVIDPDLVPSVDDAGNQIFIDRFGMQTTEVPDDNYFLEGKGSALYKKDDLQTLVDSEPAKLTGEQTEFDFGEEGDRLVEIVTDPIQFNATRESGNADSRVYWGKNFLTVNVDNGDQPVNIDLRPGKYNATQLAAEVERSINEAYGDDSKIQIVQNVDDTLSINLFKLNADGSSTGLTTAVAVDLLSDSYVSTVEGITLTGASPDFTREQFLAHSQAKINAALNDYAVDASTDVVDGASALGVSNQLFARSVGTQMDAILNKTQIINLKHSTSTEATPTTASTSVTDRYMVYSYQGARPNLSVYDNKTQVNTTGNTVSFDATQNTMTINFASAPGNISINEKIRIGGEFAAADDIPASHINGREFTVSNVSGSSITINTTGLSFPDDSFALTETDIYVLSDESESVEAFFEGAENVYEGAAVNFSSEKIVIREIGDANKHAYTNSQMAMTGTHTYTGSLVSTTQTAVASTSTTSVAGSGATFDISTDASGAMTVSLNSPGTGYVVGDTITVDGASLTGGTTSTDDVVFTVASIDGIISVSSGQFTITEASTGLDSLDVLGLRTASATATSAMTTTTDWVDEKAPAIKLNYNENTQKLEFTVDRTVLGTGTESNFNSFSIFGSSTAESTNNLGIPTQDDATTSLIRGGEILTTESFVADGEEIQLNDKRYGVSVNYNSDTQTFTFASGTTGELIEANGALDVPGQQKASGIVVGRYSLSEADGSVIDTTDHFSGDNHLMSVGTSKNDVIASAGTGLASTPAVSVGDAANEDLTSVFRMTNTNGENVFNVSVNGISGVIEIPTGFYVGSTLAEALESRINQIQDPVTGDTVGGVTVKYDSTANNFTFTTGTTGNTSTVKVKGAARFGLDEVALGVGTVPQIYNLVQATNADGVALYVDATGNVVTTPPDNLVEGYYPLYIDEGELTFDNGGRIISPKNLVHYERQEEGFSIALDIDFGQSTQFAQPFSVLNVEQDGFTSGRLDGLEIDASGTIRANYTNGQNNPLGKIVLANFNNQNGLKQIGNATYVETAVSGAAQVGEAGAEGYGNILSGSLERSNVDITEELVNLITAQRNFQASAKAIETTTTLTTTIINIR